MNDHAHRDPRYIMNNSPLTAFRIFIYDLRYLSRIHQGVPAPPSKPAHPGTTLADAKAYLEPRKSWRGRPDCRHVYTTSYGKTVESVE